jgi:transposase
LYPENAGPYLSIDETSLSNGELYTIVTNKAAKGRKGSLLAMVKGTQAASVIEILRKIPKRIRSKVREVTLDMAANMGHDRQVAASQRPQRLSTAFTSRN